jgi:putative FmdB family regulatory protein
MPFYEYECKFCKFYSEVMQKISDAPLRKCPSCGRNGFVKLVSAPVFRLKGSGWYETDFKSDKENKRNLVGSDPAEPKADSGKDKPAADAKASDSKASDSKASDSKASDSKSAEAKGGADKDSKRSEPRREATKSLSKTRAKAPAKRAKPKPAAGKRSRR